jgi:surfeit locus 1 family protein
MMVTHSGPPWWATLTVGLLGAAFVGLGLWQLGKAEAKREFIAKFEAGRMSEPVPAPASVQNLDALRYQSIVAIGQYDSRHQILLDARTRTGRAGYEVLTPLRGEAHTILVNRGWVPAAPDRTRLPAVDVSGGVRKVRGLLDHLPRAALASGTEKGDQHWPRRMLFPTATRIEESLGYPVEHYQLLLDPREPDGFDRQWRPAVMTAQQHLGYAVQWFALAGTLVVIYAVLGFRKKTHRDE